MFPAIEVVFTKIRNYICWKFILERQEVLSNWGLRDINPVILFIFGLHDCFCSCTGRT